MLGFKCDALRSSKRPQYVAAIIVNLSALFSGMLGAWPSPMISQLTRENPSVGTEPMTENEISWLSSISYISTICILPFYTWLAERFGRKTMGYFMALSAAAGWLFILFAQNLYHLLVSRLLTGLVHGICFSSVPVYVSEIAEESIRGRLGSLLGLGINLGFLITFICGALLSYHSFAIYGTVVPLIFFVAFIFIPETPIYLMRKGDDKQAVRSLMWLRNNDKEIVDREMLQLEKDLIKMTNSSKSTGLIDLFRDRGTIKGFIISLGLFGGQQTSGCTIVIMYTAMIFELANSSLAPAYAAIVVASIQLFGSLLAPLVIDRIGRRALILLSCSGMAICHVLFSIFFLLKNNSYDISSFSFVPLVALSAYSIFYCMGLGPAAYVVATEVLKPDIASHGISMSLVLALICGFVTTKFFPFISSEYGSHVSFLILTLFCTATFIFTFLLVPETKGRSMVSIFEELNGKRCDGNGSLGDGEV
ncbi:facilitated trehalose transporter Tret1 isoform X2 [Fopius arisanus]|uniref:Facilitated trehalose transporter Tret1 isoform X2 n=1 Tax=Fopius arisanus TaxID=64838 RepID=A0A0C9RE03_9HYME|nr:PREDICTED: facilitated trehalose transporter Tret1-like isoform X2 [Fopius arisanus]XP_011309450.1 PREDICTED: facilitated trehalose transporter Tret1-like isoform X2 [Fopius arisanus]XP_011309451.1 PREDICTED: facilitated trehalose transporter Tret1-like isoform X2 [Fopius arisanus]XP_011309452.1 PREDICTED: facilitated trehalose transporter Tret1-like isoform X2 [Fopius arisanus]